MKKMYTMASGGKRYKRYKIQSKKSRKFCSIETVKASLPDVEDISNEQLPKILEDFYMPLQSIDSKQHKLQTQKCIRSVSNRYIKEQHSLHIISGENFLGVNKFFSRCHQSSQRGMCHNSHFNQFLMRI